MPVAAPGLHHHRLIRRVLCVRGDMRFRVEVEPRFDYGRAAHETAIHEHGAVFSTPELTLALASSVELEPRNDGVYGEFSLAPGESATFVLETAPENGVPRRFSEDETRRDFEDDRCVLAPLALTVAIQGPLARDGAPLGARAEAPDLPADGRDRRRADDEPARADRRRAELGLPLHLDPRHRLLPLRAAPARLHRGGGRVHGLAHRPLPRARGERVRPAPDHVPDRRQLGSRRGGARRTSRATSARPRSGSGTAPPTSSSSTSTAS